MFAPLLSLKTGALRVWVFFGDASKPGSPRRWLNFSERVFGLAIMALVFLAAGGNLQAADVSLYEITKGIKYLQTNSSAAAEIFPNGYPFSTDVYGVVTNSVSSASVESPGTYLFLPLEFTGTHYQWQVSFNTLPGLDANYGNGTYLLDITGVHDGSRQLSLPLQGSLYPNAPRISNFAATQSLYATGYCLVTWDRFTAGTTADLIRFSVQATDGTQFYQTGNVGEQQALNGTATWVLLEPGRLKPNSNYLAKLTFQKNMAVNRSSYPGALGVTAYTAETQLKLVTLSSAGPDVKDVELAKSLRWVQAGDSAPVPEPKPAQFSATARMYRTSSVTTASLLLPANSLLSSTNLLLQPDLLTLRFVETARTPADLDAGCGTGAYALNLPTPHDGAKSLAFNLQSVTNAPQAPQVLQFNSLQSIRATRPFTVAWLPWTNATVSDFIQLSIQDSAGVKVFSTPGLGSPNALHGLVTNALVPAGVLAGGQAYTAQLMFQRNASLNTTNYPGVLALADYHSQTSFSNITAPADIASYEILKGQVFRQIDAGAPRSFPTNGYYFAAAVEALTSNTITGATVTTPGNLSETLARAEQTSWTFTNRASTLPALNSAYAAGHYLLKLNCANDGIQSLYLSLPTTLPPPPHLLGYDPTQLHDAALGFNLAWDPFIITNTPTASNSFIQLTIRDYTGQTVYAAAELGSSNGLPATTVNYFVPAGVLNPNSFYYGSLVFETIYPTNAPAYAQTPGQARLVSETQFTFGTYGPGNPPVLTAGWSAANHQLLFNAEVVSNQSYRVEYCTNFPPYWLPLLTNTSSSNVLWFADPGASVRPQTFYRLRVWP